MESQALINHQRKRELKLSCARASDNKDNFPMAFQATNGTSLYFLDGYTSTSREKSPSRR